MNNKIKLLVTNSLVISIIRYVMPLFKNINYKQINTINVLVMKAARQTIGYHSYKWSNYKVREHSDGLRPSSFSLLQRAGRALRALLGQFS